MTTRHVDPMLAQPAELPEDSGNWAFEVKWDGMRTVAFVSDGTLRLETRNRNDVTAQYPDLVASMPAALARRDAILDGEVIAPDEQGRPSFQLLQSRMGLSNLATIRTRAAAVGVQYMAFDLLELDGRDLRAEPYQERRRILRGLFRDTRSWRVPAHHVGEGRALLDAIIEQGMEGVVAKRLGSPYRERQRGGDWRKIKHHRRQEFVIGGWTEGAGQRAGELGSLLVGYHTDDGRLRFAGGVGTGMSDRVRAELATSLASLALDSSPFQIGGPGAGEHATKWRAMRGADSPQVVHFVQPKFVCEVAFAEFTRDGTLRHASYHGLRTDKHPRDVVREDA